MIKSSTETIIVIKRLVSITLIMLSLNLFSLNMGYASPIFLRVCGLVCLLAMLITYMKSYKKVHIKSISVVGASLILLSFIALTSIDKPEFWILSTIIFICGFNLLLRSAGEDEPQISALALGSLFYAILYIYYINDPTFWRLSSSLSQAVFAVFGRLEGIPIALGPTISGALIFLSFLCCAVSFFILSEKRSSYPIKALIAVLVVLTMLYIVYFLTVIGIWTSADRYMDHMYLVFFVLLIPFLIFVSKMRIKSIDLGSWIPSPGQVAILTAIFSAVLLIAIVPHFNSGGIGKVVLYEKDSEMGFDIPDFPEANQSFAPDDGFSVGAIKRYLENMGAVVESLNTTDSRDMKEALKDADILVLLNLKKGFSSSDLQSIGEYVKNGGSLLVFAEHTSMFVPDQDFASGRDYLNDVLDPTGIRINPDTADFIPDHWQYAATALPHPITRDLDFDLTTSSVGASLSLNGQARPLIIGRFAFSDKSNQSTPGHMGDRLYEPGEVMGDLVVAACDTFGKGKVLVFGDTSYIFNNELPFRYNLVYNSVSWLTSRESDYAAYQCYASFFLLFALAAYILVTYIFTDRAIIKRYRIKMSLRFLICLALAVALSLGLSTSINNSLTKPPEEPLADVAWIDYTHLNQFNLENYRDDGVAGLTLNLFRNGLLPQLLQKDNSISDIRKGAVAIIIAPNEDYTAKEALEIKEFVEAGGLLILCAGYKSTGPMDLILKSFGLGIGDLPLGSFPWIEETHATGGQAIVSPENLRRYWHKPKFMEAYPVLADGEFRPITWMRYNGVTYNLIIEKRAGRGNVILIGDSRFLLNENLEQLSQGAGKENREQYQLQWLGNIELLRKILTVQKVEMT
jgi:hypothetical protein